MSRRAVVNMERRLAGPTSLPRSSMRQRSVGRTTRPFNRFHEGTVTAEEKTVKVSEPAAHRA
jgi:hypothetical protein